MTAVRSRTCVFVRLGSDTSSAVVLVEGFGSVSDISLCCRLFCKDRAEEVIEFAGLRGFGWIGPSGDDGIDIFELE